MSLENIADDGITRVSINSAPNIKAAELIGEDLAKPCLIYLDKQNTLTIARIRDVAEKSTYEPSDYSPRRGNSSGGFIVEADAWKQESLYKPFAKTCELFEIMEPSSKERRVLETASRYPLIRELVQETIMQKLKESNPELRNAEIVYEPRELVRLAHVAGTAQRMKMLPFIQGTLKKPDYASNERLPIRFLMGRDPETMQRAAYFVGTKNPEPAWENIESTLFIVRMTGYVHEAGRVKQKEVKAAASVSPELAAHLNNPFKAYASLANRLTSHMHMRCAFSSTGVGETMKELSDYLLKEG